MTGASDGSQKGPKNSTQSTSKGKKTESSRISPKMTSLRQKFERQDDASFTTLKVVGNQNGGPHTRSNSLKNDKKTSKVGPAGSGDQSKRKSSTTAKVSSVSRDDIASASTSGEGNECENVSESESVALNLIGMIVMMLGLVLNVRRCLQIINVV
jgi:hypothetical protein